MASKYPSQIDDSTSIPVLIDLKSAVKAQDNNLIRDGLIKIQQELGTDPSREYSTVRSRLDAIQNTLNAIEEISGETFIPSLEQVLLEGNTTNGSNIIVSSGDNIQGSAGTLVIASDTQINANEIKFGSSNTPRILQLSTTDEAGRDLTIQAQNNDSASAAGDLILTSGTNAGAGNDGNTVIQVGTVNAAIFSPSTATSLSAASTGYILRLGSSGALEYADLVHPDNLINDGYTSNDDTPGIIDIFTPTTNDVIQIELSVFARDTVNDDAASWRIIGVFKRVAGTVTQIGLASIIVEEKENIDMNIDISTDGTNIQLELTGDDTNEVSWNYFGVVQTGTGPHVFR